MGDTLTYLTEKGDHIRFRIIGGLDNSVFQGSLLVDAGVFLKYFPSSAASKCMIIDAPKTKQKKVTDLLNSSFADYGMDVIPTSKRLAEFNSIENTYLSVFMVLGGLGFMLGTFGLGIILFRNILERQQEFSMMQALGFKKNWIFRLVLFENLFLLVCGISIGLGSALIGILPSLFSTGYTIHSFLFFLIATIFVSGFICIYFTSKFVMTMNLKDALRND